MAQTYIKTFTTNGTLAIPAGVTSVQVNAQALTKPWGLPISSNTTQVPTTYLIDSNGNLFAQGSNVSGQFGNSTVTGSSVPTAITTPLVAWRDIFLTSQVTSPSVIGTDTQNRIWGWGGNTVGECGIGSTTAVSVPTLCLGGLRVQSVQPISVTTGNTSGLIALAETGSAWSWGSNSFGEAGTGVSSGSTSSPVLVLGGLTFQQISCGIQNVLGLTTAGAAYAWGSNSNGQLGVGDTTNRSTPVAVLGGLTFASVKSSGNCNFGLTSAGALYAWGQNSSGQLGVGDVTPRSSPVLVLGGLTFKQISVAGNSIFGITTTGVGYAWGSNNAGTLGVGDVNARSSPVAILGGLTFSSIYVNSPPGSTNSYSVVSLTTAGTAYAWGSNTSGALGIGGTTNQSSPIVIQGGLTFNNLYGNGISGQNSFFGVTNAGVLYGWGINTSGQLGINSTSNVTSPTAVVGGFLGRISPVSSNYTFSVTPGSSYAVTVTGNTAFFGTNAISTSPVSSVTISYQQ